VADWSERLEEEHPEMRHEIARDAVVRVVQQYSHAILSIVETAKLAQD
jgi:hypothetical protein